MRVVALLLVLACCTALDDPAAPTLAASPTPLRRRRARQAAVSLVPTAALWWLAFAVTMAPAGATAWAAALIIEGTALLAIAWTVALLAQRFGQHQPSPSAAAVTAAALVVIIHLPRPIALFTELTDPSWQDAHQRWAVLLALLLATAALATRDPGARSIRQGNR